MEDSTTNIIHKIHLLKPILSRSEQRIADYICENPHEVIRLSIAGLAEACSTSEATIVRMARHIGLSGYQDLKITLAKSIITPLQSIHEEISENDSTAAMIDKVFSSSIHALRFTRNNLCPEALEQSAQLIRNANSVIILGVGASHAAALDLQHKLLRIGIRAYVYADPHYEAIAAAALTAADVVIAISHSGSSRDIVDCAQLSKAKGAAVISITSAGSSPLSKTSDIALHTTSKETQYRIVSLSSRIAQLAIIDSIYTLIAAKDITTTTEHFREIENALKTKKY